MLGVLWLHWTPDAWRGHTPFAAGLFFLLCLTGFLITRILLRERASGEMADIASGGGDSREGWRWAAYRRFQKRRALRILAPCVAAMLFAWLLGAPDLRAHPWMYLFQLGNFHLATLKATPEVEAAVAGSAHFWTLAIQQQIYLLWPFVILWTPRRALLPALVGMLALGPVSRVIAWQFPETIPHPGLLTPCAVDYFAAGGLLAHAMERGALRPGDTRLSWIGTAAFLPYLLLYTSRENIPGVHHLQQTFLALVFTALISASLRGFSGIMGKVLEHSVIQHIAKISYSLYLFHGPMPLLVGYVLPFLWKADGNGMIILRILAYGLFSWAGAWLGWRYLEAPLERMKRKASSPG